MPTTMSDRARELHAQRPDLTVREIARELGCSRSLVRLALQRQPRGPVVGAQHVLELPPDLDRAVCEIALARGETFGVVVARLLGEALVERGVMDPPEPLARAWAARRLYDPRGGG